VGGPQLENRFSAIVIEDDNGLRTGLLMLYAGDPSTAESTLECLLGSRVAVRTTGVLESFNDQLLRQLVPPIDKALRWGGEIHRYVAGQ
jgi:hypothetical protein